MNQFHYRVRVPPDADVTHLERSDEDKLIRIRLPKLEPRY